MGFFPRMHHVRGCGLVAEFVAEFFAGLVGVEDVYFVGSGGG